MGYLCPMLFARGTATKNEINDAHDFYPSGKKFKHYSSTNCELATSELLVRVTQGLHIDIIIKSIAQ